MKTLFLAAGVAALAIAAPAASKPGGGHGGGQTSSDGRGGGGQAKGHGGGGGKFTAARGGGASRSYSQHSGGGGGRQFAMQRQGGGGHDFARQQKHGGGHARKVESHGNQQRLARADRSTRHEFKAERGNRKFASADHRMKAGGNDKRVAVRTAQRRDLSRNASMERGFDRYRGRGGDYSRDWSDNNRWAQARGLSNGCPPGLAMKNNGCLPPGQARKLLGQALPAAYASRYLPDRLRNYYRDDDDYYYRYGDGYLYRVDRRSNLVNSLLPLLGGGYMVGQQFPYGYSNASYAMPAYYQPFYMDTADDYYRYNNGYVYDIDRGSGLIEDIYPALGYGYGVGDMLPASYSYYNLPYQYRDVYADNDDYYYRYAPGAIYQVDRSTSLITSVASLLTGGTGLGIGQQLPMGYGAYNVPYDYRDRYYDTSENWYRYANGNIYQVDPTTQLITAVINALV
ncbi:MAG: hypothetical protein ACJ8EY_11720 [Sphingomicrobium sp.]